MVKQKTTTVDERNPAPLHNIYLVYSIIYRDLYILGGCLASPPRLGRNMLHMALMRHRLTPCFEWGWLCHWGRLVLKISQKRKGRFGEKYCREILLIWLQFVFFFFFLGGGRVLFKLPTTEVQILWGQFSRCRTFAMILDGCCEVFVVVVLSCLDLVV